MIKILAIAALLISSPAKALISVMEGLPTTKDAVFVGTTTPQLILNATSYNGTVPTVSLYSSSNVVVGSNGCVLYSTGTIYCLGVRVSTGDPVGVYVPYSGATADVNIGAKKLTTTGNIQGGQIGAGTAPSSNFYFDGLSSSGGGFVRIGAGVNQAAGYYWGGTRGYSMQERYDLSGTPFTLHDELNNVDRFYLDTSGAWYFPLSTTVSSLTVISASVGISGATENVNASMIGNGSLGSSLGVSPSSVAVLSGGNVVNAQIDHSSVPFLSGGLINNYQIDHSSVDILSSGKVNNYLIDNSSIARLNSSGLIPNYQIDPSSVNKVIGISSGPAGSAQFLENATIVNGVVTGGDFAAASGGASNNPCGAGVLISSYDFNTAGQSISSVSFVAAQLGLVDFASATYSINFVGISTNSVHWFMSYNNIETASYVNGTYGLVSGFAGLTQTEPSYNIDYCAGGVLSGTSQDYAGQINFRTAMGSNVKMITDSRNTMSSFNANTPALSVNGGTITLSSPPKTISFFASTVADCSSASMNHVGSFSKIHLDLCKGIVHQ